MLLLLCTQVTSSEAQRVAMQTADIMQCGSRTRHSVGLADGVADVATVTTVGICGEGSAW